MLDAAYWARNLRAPVQFWNAMQALVTDGHTLFVELSPHPTHVTALADGLRALGVTGAALPTLRRDQPVADTLLTTLGALYCAGVALDWRQIAPQRHAAHRLPTYPFQRERYWVDLPRQLVRAQTRGHAGEWSGVRLCFGRSQWNCRCLVICTSGSRTSRLTASTICGITGWMEPWCVPGTTYVDWMLAAGVPPRAEQRTTWKTCGSSTCWRCPTTACGVCRWCCNRRARVGRGAILQPALEFKCGEIPPVRSGPCTPPALVRPATEPEPTLSPPSAALARSSARCSTRMTGADFYALLAEQGLEYGPRFQGLSEIHAQSGRSACAVSVGRRPRSTRRSVYPSRVAGCRASRSWARPCRARPTIRAVPPGWPAAPAPHSARSAMRSGSTSVGCESSRRGKFEGDLTVYDADWSTASLAVNGLRAAARGHPAARGGQ